jgi:hypothetical protein
VGRLCENNTVLYLVLRRWNVQLHVDTHGSDEDDIALVFNYSNGVDTYPTIAYTGRKVTDIPGTMGQGASAPIVSGTHDNTSGRWGDYSACAVPLNSVTRGTIWCAGEYTGNVLSPGWNTRLYALRVE